MQILIEQLVKENHTALALIIIITMAAIVCVINATQLHKEKKLITNAKKMTQQQFIEAYRKTNIHQQELENIWQHINNSKA